MAKYKNTLIAYDGNWLINRAYSVYRTHSNPALSTAKQVVAWAFEYAFTNQATHFLMCIDGDNVFRKLIYPDYKSSRKSNGNAGGKALDDMTEVDGGNPAYECLPELFYRLKTLKVPTVQKPEYEADDLMASCSAKFSGPNTKVILTCKDKDAIQSLNDDTVLWTPPMGIQPAVTTTNKNLIKYHTSFASPQQFLQYQILIGDKMDDVPSLMSESKAKKVLKEHGTLGTWFKTEEGKAWYKKNQGPLLLNKDLVTMAKHALDEVSLNDLKPVMVKGLENLKPKHYYNCLGVSKNVGRSLFG